MRAWRKGGMWGGRRREVERKEEAGTKQQKGSVGRRKETRHKLMKVAKRKRREK